jgi:hypothetical protein
VVKETAQKGDASTGSSMNDSAKSSDLGDDEPELDLLQEEYVAIGSQSQINFNLQPAQEKKHALVRKEISFMYISEILLSLSGSQISLLYLLYDCQPFSESLISKSVGALFRYYQKSQNPQDQVKFRCICTKLIEKFKHVSPDVTEHASTM